MIGLAIALIGVGACVPGVAAAQSATPTFTASEIFDVNPKAGGSSDPAELTALGDALLFTATKDGKPDKDVVWRWPLLSPGWNPVATKARAPSDLTAVVDGASNAVYFVARTLSDHGVVKLWFTTGLPISTYPVDYKRAQAYGTPQNLTDMETALDFSTQSAKLGSAWLWSTTGRASTTKQLAALPMYGATGSLTGFTQGGTTIYFVFDPGGDQPAIWQETGGQASQVTDSPSAPDIGNLTDFNGTLYFTATDPSQGSGGLWSVSDGVATLVHSFSGADALADLTVDGNDLYYEVSTGAMTTLWSTGTSGSTQELSGSPADVSGLTDIGGTLYLAGTSSADGDTIWTVSGSSVAPLPGAASGASDDLGDIASITSDDGTLLFSASSPATGDELWQWSGTSGPVLVDDIDPGAAGSDPTDLTVVRDVLYFAADDGTTGDELWAASTSG